MDEAEIISTIEKVVAEVVREQITHLQRGRVERTFTTDLAHKLRPLFENESVTVDPFYNRHHKATKYLNGRVIELDVAIHKRGEDEHNLVAIELETNNNPERNDIWKLEGLTDSLGGYGYKLGLFLVAGISERAGEIITLEWFKDGKPLR